MMKKKFRPDAAQSNADTTSQKPDLIKTPSGSPHMINPSRQTDKSINEKKHSLKDSRSEDALLSRLASGQKVTVDPKQMKRLTTKNYSQLPEVKQKQEEERKQKDFIEKKQKVLQYQKELNAKVRSQMAKKRDRDRQVLERQKSSQTIMNQSEYESSILGELRP